MRKTTIAHKLFLALLAVTFPVFFTGASIWEGAAAVSSGGDLPDSGFYAATNSFPRNTVVDITNLETGRTVRVIVAATLDSPGLLAVLSKEGAQAIGLQSRSIGRIRMIQPSDPIAYSRFGGENPRSGDPDFDPEAALKAYGTAAENAAVDAGKTTEPPVSTPKPPPSITESPPSTTEPPAKKDAAAVPADSLPAGREYPKDDLPSTGISGPEKDGGSKIAGPVEYQPDPWEKPEGYDEGYGGEVAETASEEAGEHFPPETAWFVPNYETEPGETQNRINPESELSFVPAGEEPPGISAGYPDPSHFIDPVSKTPGQAKETPLFSPPASSAFGVPELGTLEAGKYYLQLGAYSKSDAVETAIGKIEKGYPVAVQRAGSAEKPVYRILVGPITHGESGALLQRFKGRGYTDAFIRKGN